ncbi:MAG: peptide chain release factor 2 [Chloroflexota bacterium]
METIIDKLNQLSMTLDELRRRLDLAGKEERKIELEKKASDPNIWNDKEKAQHTMRQLTQVTNEIDRIQRLEEQLIYVTELAELEDESIKQEIEDELALISVAVDKLDFHSILSNEYDSEDAILAIHAGAGGTDSQDWAEMLQRMYLRWAETNGFTSELLSATAGEEAGVKSVTIGISGQYAYGYLQSERGVHRLVRLSPFDAAHRRHTSFALVEVWPDVRGEIEVEIKQSELQIERFRAAGAGGQHVQKNETAVRITHAPTGIVVACQNERSQKQNLESAMKVLRARLVAIEQQRREDQVAQLKGEHIDAGWGNQIRSYVLHPYQLVKDHRTLHETGNTNAVLDGNLDSFMQAFLKQQAEETHATK